MIRFICVVVFLILFLILTIPVFFIEWLIGKFNRNARDYSCLRIVQWGFKAILKVTGVHTTVIGFENIPDEPVLFIGNHRSFFDILLTYSRCPRLTGYVAKKEMEKIPLLSTWMRFVYCPVSYTHLRAHETSLHLVCRLLLEKKKIFRAGLAGAVLSLIHI